jgi:hypothetical protein
MTENFKKNKTLSVIKELACMRLTVKNLNSIALGSLYSTIMNYYTVREQKELESYLMLILF